MNKYEDSKNCFNLAFAICHGDVNRLANLCQFADGYQEDIDPNQEIPLMEWFYLWAEEAGHPYQESDHEHS